MRSTTLQYLIELSHKNKIAKTLEGDTFETWLTKSKVIVLLVSNQLTS